MIKKAEKFVEIFIMVLLVVMVILACWQVAARYLLGNPSSWTEELLIYMMTWSAMIGGAYAYGQKAHIAIGYLYNKCTEVNKASLDIVINSLVLVFAVLVLVYGGGMLTISSIGRSTASLGVSFAWVYLCVLISGLMFSMYAVGFIIEGYKNLNKLEEGEK